MDICSKLVNFQNKNLIVLLLISVDFLFIYSDLLLFHVFSIFFLHLIFLFIFIHHFIL